MSTAAKLKQARVLYALHAHGIQAGQIIEAEPGLIEQLAKDGAVDPSRDAVAYARENGAKVMRSALELQAEARRQRLDELRVSIAETQALADKPESDDATRAALQRKLAALQTELADLG